MKNLIIDAATETFFFSIISESESYTTSHVNSRENFDNFLNLLMDFLEKNKTKLNNIDNLFINQGPGKFSGIRISIAVAKAIVLTNSINLYGFNSKDYEEGGYKKILELHKKGLLIKDLIKPLYLS